MLAKAAIPAVMPVAKAATCSMTNAASDNLAAKSVRDLRVAEVVRQDVTIENGKVASYRVRLGLSFKYETGD